MLTKNKLKNVLTLGETDDKIQNVNRRSTMKEEIQWLIQVLENLFVYYELKIMR